MKKNTLKPFVLLTLAFSGLSLLSAVASSAAVIQFHQQIQLPPARPAPQPASRPAAQPAPQRQSQPTPQHQPASQHQSQPEPQHQPKPAQSRPSAAAPQEQQERQQARQPKQAQKQQHKQARQQKQQEENARRQKQQQMQAQKQQLKEQQKTARQQKELQKQQRKQAKANSTSRSSATSRSERTANSAESLSASATGSGIPATSPESRGVYTAPGSTSVSMKMPSGAAILTPRGSENVLLQVNSARASMAGINRKPLPSGDVMVHPNGSLTISAAGGARYGVRANGTIASYATNGKTASFDRNGRVSSIHSDSMDIHRGAHGERMIISHRADNTTLVTTGPHSGYLERTVVVNNHTFIQRTVVINGRTYTHAYVAYSFGGVVLNHYVNPISYAPGFYGWVYYPWAAPFSFRWGWLAEPWYLGPNPYFVAYPVYPSASLWLTDYLIGQTLSTAYQQHADAFASDLSDAGYDADASLPDAEDSDRPVTLRADSTTPITPEIKAVIAEQVKQQIASDNASTANPKPAGSFGELPYALHSANYIFVVSRNLDVTTVDQQGCGLQAGDILQLTTPPADGSAIAILRVASSRPLDCPAGVEVSVSLQDLQDMQNNFCSQIELGLGSLLANQGHNGFPALPPDAAAAPPRPSLAGLGLVPSDELSTLLQKQQQQAHEIETRIAQMDFDTPTGHTN